MADISREDLRNLGHSLYAQSFFLSDSEGEAMGRIGQEIVDFVDSLDQRDEND